MFFQSVTSALMSWHSSGFVPPALQEPPPPPSLFREAKNLSLLPPSPRPCHPRRELGGISPQGWREGGSDPRVSPQRCPQEPWLLPGELGFIPGHRSLPLPQEPSLRLSAASQGCKSLRWVSVFHTLPADYTRWKAVKCLQRKLKFIPFPALLGSQLSSCVFVP